MKHMVVFCSRFFLRHYACCLHSRVNDISYLISASTQLRINNVADVANATGRARLGARDLTINYYSFLQLCILYQCLASDHLHYFADSILLCKKTPGKVKDQMRVSR